MTNKEKAEHAILNISFALQSMEIAEDIAQHQAFHLVKNFTGLVVEKLRTCSSTCTE